MNYNYIAAKSHIYKYLCSRADTGFLSAGALGTWSQERLGLKDGGSVGEDGGEATSHMEVLKCKLWASGIYGEQRPVMNLEVGTKSGSVLTILLRDVNFIHWSAWNL